MSPEVRLTRLSVDDDEVLNRAVPAYVEYASGCDSMTDVKGALIGYVEGMNNYYGSDVFVVDTSDELSFGLVTACFDGHKITIEDLFVSKVARNRGIGRAAIAALAGEYPDARVIELYSLKSAEGFYQRIGFKCISPADNKCLSLWRKELD